MGGLGWFGATPDGETFMMLLYGGNIGQFNYARFKLPQYDALFEQAKGLPFGPERTALYRRMSELIAVYVPWKLDVYQIESTVIQPWVLGYKKNPFMQHPWRFLDIDLARRPAVAGQ
jgi:ABC-type transport system substrate-binding protein